MNLKGFFYAAISFFALLTAIGIATPVYAQKAAADQKQPPASYRIHAGDKLSIRFFANPELNETAIIVRPDGFINPQLVDDIKAEGLTVAELKATLEKAYNEIVLTPMLTVSIVDFVPERVFVGGQVNKAGPYELREAKTLVQAVFMAGGFTNDARRTMVIHARPNGKGEWDIQTADFMKILQGKGTEKDIVLKDGDYVFVPNSRISEFTKAVDAFRAFIPRFL